MSNVPPEIDSLINGSGSLLLVKGNAGVGKTLFVLELIKEYGGLYVSTTVKPERLYKDCPGLEEAIPKDFFLDATHYRPVPQRRAHFKLDVDDSILKEILEAAPPSIQQSNLPPLLQEINHKIEVAKVPFCVVVDSWDAIFALGDFRSDRDQDPTWGIEGIQKTLINLFRKMPLNLIMVSEGGLPNNLDYLVDAVVELGSEQDSGRLVRKFKINKLRGSEIRQSEYVFTLSGGAFRYFDPAPFEFEGDLAEWRAVPDPPGRFSTGSRSLDDILGGGLIRGSTVLIEVGNNVPQIVYETLIKSVSANFLSHGRSIILVPIAGMDITRFEREMTCYVGIEEFETFARIMVSADVEGVQDKGYLVPVDYKDIEADLREWEQTYNRLREATGSASTLEIIGMDTQEARYGEEVYKKILPLSAEQTKREGNLVIRLSRPGLESVNQRGINIADMHLKMREKNGVTLLIGAKPYTGTFVVTPYVVDGNVKLSMSRVT